MVILLLTELDVWSVYRTSSGLNEPRSEKTGLRGVSDTNRAVQSQKMPRGLKFWI